MVRQVINSVAGLDVDKHSRKERKVIPNGNATTKKPSAFIVSNRMLRGLH